MIFMCEIASVYYACVIDYERAILCSLMYGNNATKPADNFMFLLFFTVDYSI